MTAKPSTVPAELIGFWTISGGDYNLTNEYRADDTLLQHVAGRIGRPIPFRVERNQIILRIEQPDGEFSEQSTRFELVNDTLTFFDSETSKRVFQKKRGGLFWVLRRFGAKLFGRRPWVKYNIAA